MVDELDRRGFLLASGALIGTAATARWRPALATSRIPMRDIIVVLPGITGSALRKDGRDLWAISVEGVLGALKSLGHNLNALKLVEDPADVDDLGDGVVADRLIHDLHMVPGLWKIDGYTKIVRRLLADFDLTRGQNFFEFPYDWRRDNRVGARRLARATHGWLKAWRDKTGNRDARLILIAHSMGGLVCRYFLEVLEGWRDTRRLISIGTPYRGSLNALGFISNGLSKGLGPINILDLTELLRSFTSVYQLLPIYRCYDAGDGSLKRVAEASGIPHLDVTKALKALQFHREIESAVASNLKNEQYLRHGYAIHPVVGTHQPTLQSARLVAGRVTLAHSYPSLIMDGDGTVPRVSATPIELSGKQAELFVSETHGSLQNFDPVLAQLQGLLASDSINWDRFRNGLPPDVALTVDDAYSSDEVIVIGARCKQENAALVATVMHVDTGEHSFHGQMKPMGDGLQQVELPKLQAGAYRVSIKVVENVPSVTDVFVVGDRT